MSFFWDLLQQSQLGDQRRQAQALETRVADLEQRLADTQRAFARLLEYLESRFGDDLDGDGRAGS